MLRLIYSLDPFELMCIKLFYVVNVNGIIVQVNTALFFVSFAADSETDWSCFIITTLNNLTFSVVPGQVRSGIRIVRGPLRRSSTMTAVDSLSP